MEITYLKEFIELADRLSFTEAAEKLYISQSVLSKHIKTLEKELDMRLFDRNNKQVGLTDFGKRYVKYAREIASKYDESEKWRKDYIMRSNNTIRIGLPESQELYEVEDHFLLFNRMYPEITIETQEYPSYNLIHKFEQGVFNIFLTGMTVDVDVSKLPFGYIEAAKGRIKACVGVNHRLSDRDVINIRDLETERVILPPNDTVFQQFIENASYKALGYHKEFLYSSYSIARMLAEAGSCVALMQEEACTGSMSEAIRIIELEPAICYTRGLGYREKMLSVAEQKYVNFARLQLE